MNAVVDLLMSLGDRFAERGRKLKAEIKAAEDKALADTKADLAQLDQLAAAAPDALRAGDARVDAAGHPATTPVTS